MKDVKFIRYQEYTESCCSRIWNNDSETMFIWVRMNLKNDSEPYFMIYDKSWPEESTKVARISFLHPDYVFCSEDPLEPWYLNPSEIEELVDYLHVSSDSNFSTWKDMLYSWDYEHGFELQHPVDSNVSSKLLYDDTTCFHECCLLDDAFLPMDTVVPDYTQLL